MEVKSDEKLEELSIPIGLAPKGWTAKRVLSYLRRDPRQTRFSLYAIPLTHPRTGVKRVLSEYAEDVVGEIRIGIETVDARIIISRLTNSSVGTIFIPFGMYTTEENLKKEGKKKIEIIG